MLTGLSKEIATIKVDSPLLEKSLVLQKNEKELEDALRADIAKLHGVSPKDVYIRRIVAGSIEVYFSLPESNTVNTNINPSNLPSFNSIMKANGITDYKMIQNSVLPDPKKAKEILESYTRPVIIKTEANGSQLMDKFGKYLAVLASLSTNVRIVHNAQSGTLEIHGPPSAKSNVLAYFAEMEDLLQGAIPSNIVIVE